MTKAIMYFLMIFALTGHGSVKERTTLGVGNVSIRLPTNVTLEKSIGFESETYKIIKVGRARTLIMLIYLGSKFSLQGLGPIVRHTIHGIGVRVITSTSRASKTVIFTLPKKDPDRQ